MWDLECFDTFSKSFGYDCGAGGIGLWQDGRKFLVAVSLHDVTTALREALEHAGDIAEHVVTALMAVVVIK